MNSETIIEILELAAGLAKSQLSGRLKEDATVTESILKITQKGAQAYREHTGEAIDPEVIKFEPPLA